MKIKSPLSNFPSSLLVSWAKFPHWSVIIILFFFFLGLINYAWLEKNLLLLILLVLTGLFSLYSFLSQGKIEAIIFLTGYWLGFNLYYYLSHGLMPLWLVMILLLIILGSLIFLLLKSWLSDRRECLFYSLLILIVNGQIFLALSAWPTNEQSKSIIFLIFFYFCWGLVNLKWQEKLKLSNALPYILITLLLITAVSVTVPWVGY